VVRDIFAVGSMISYYNTIIGTIYFRAALIVILIIIVNNKIKGNWIDIGFFIKWISIVVGSLFFFLFTESILMIISGWNSHRMIVLIFDFIFILIPILIVLSYAQARFKNKKEVLLFILKPYCYFSIYIAFTGLLAWIIVVFNLVDLSSWHLPAEMLPRNVSKDNYGTLYAFPYYLGLVMAGREATFLGFPVFRAAGLFHEPTYAAFFVLPSFFYLPFVFKESASKLTLKLSMATIILFAVVSYSAAGIIVFSITLCLSIFEYLSRNKFDIKYIIITTLMFVVGSFVVFLAVDESGTFAKKLKDINFYTYNSIGLVDSNSLFKDSFFSIKHDYFDGAYAVLPRALLSTFSQLIHIIIVLTLLIGLFFSRKYYRYVVISMIYTLMHSFKNLLFFEFTGLYIYQLVIFAIILSLSSKTITHAYNNIKNPYYT